MSGMSGNWLRKPKGGATTQVVVFVHGFLSNRQDCWRHNNGSYWPDLFEQVRNTWRHRHYVFEYFTNVFSGNYNLDDAVDSLKEQLSLDDVLTSGRIIFVCHSMGGIVARKYIIQNAPLVY